MGSFTRDAETTELIEVVPLSIPNGCDGGRATETSVETLNHSCRCLSLDNEALRRNLEAELGKRSLSHTIFESHSNLFASVPLFVARTHLDQMAQLVGAVETVVATSHFRRAALSWAPDIAHYDPGSPGGLLGFDFHLALEGPRLIEINTNPGGALLNAVLGRAQRSCCPETVGLAMAPVEADAIEKALLEIFMAEWGLQRTGLPPLSVAIVDEAPEQQYLYPEFLMYQHLFERHGIEVVICDPRELVRKDARLWIGKQAIDFVYNRLTDFALEQPENMALKLAYLAREVAVSPHPRAHAFYADKRNLSLLCDETFLRETGIADNAMSALLAAIPHTEIMTAGNRDAMWANRRTLFFKPAAGYGSRAAYRGDKLTKRVWAEMAKGTYVAQAIVAPSERQVAVAQAPVALKADVRNYAYAGMVKLVAARLYQGQTTNFRTAGGGFAPVFTEMR